MTAFPLNDITDTLLGMARSMARAIRGSTPARRERLKIIWLQKLAVWRESGTHNELILSIEQALGQNDFELALEQIFLKHPFQQVGVRYPCQDLKINLRIPKDEIIEEPVVEEVEASTNSDNQEKETLKEVKVVEVVEVESTEAEHITKVDSEVSTDSNDQDSKQSVASDESQQETAVEVEDEAVREAKAHARKLAALEAEIKKLSVSKGHKKNKRPPSTKHPRKQRVFFWHEECGGAPIESIDMLIDEDDLAVIKANGINVIADLLLRSPVNFLRPKHGNLTPDAIGQTNLFRGTICKKYIRVSSQFIRYELVLQIKESSQLRCSWLSSPPRGWDSWKTGYTISFAGELELDDIYQIFEAEPVGIDGRGSGWLPCYGITGVDDRNMREIVGNALNFVLFQTQDLLPRSVLQGSKLLFFDEALRDVHFPANSNLRGFERLAFDESFFYLFKRRAEIGAMGKHGMRCRLKHKGVGRAAMEFGVQLNDEQEVAFSAIRRNLLSSTPMRRILQGDIGAGKWFISLLSLIAVSEGEGQVIFACTDVITAERRYWMAEPILKVLGISCQLCSGTPNRAQQDAFQNGVVSVVFGTAELLSTQLSWKSLRLIIVEESKNYGAMVPMDYIKCKPAPDVLMLTPTPLSAKVLESVYPIFSLSRVPVQATSSAAQLYQSPDRTAAYTKFKASLDEGHQGYIVFPVKDGRDLLSLGDASRFAAAIQTELLEGVSIEVFSSELDRDSRRKVLEAFQQRRIDVLLCTTYIEDAQVIPNACAMVVEYAELNNLSRLHRLRGHAARYNPSSSIGWILSDGATEEQSATLEKLCRLTNGYQIAELEEQLYGFKELVGIDIDPPEHKWNYKYAQVSYARELARNIVANLEQNKSVEHHRSMINAVLQRLYPDVKLIEPAQQSTQRRRKRRYNKSRKPKK